jgi:hypothetical protein
MVTSLVGVEPHKVFNLSICAGNIIQSFIMDYCNNDDMSLVLHDIHHVPFQGSWFNGLAMCGMGMCACVHSTWIMGFKAIMKLLLQILQINVN